MALPKVLIIGQPFNNDTGGGITLSNLFNGWDRDKLAVACSGYLLLDNIDTEVCNTYYQLGHKEHKLCFPFNYLQRKYFSGLLKFDEKRIQNLTIAKSELRIKIIMDYFYPFLRYVGLFHFISKIELSKEFCRWIDEYKPDVIYAQTSSRGAILFCLSVHSYVKKPLIFHMMDDWPSTISDKGLFKKYWFKKIDHEFRILLDRAAILMSISDEMAHEYKIRYNKNFITFHNIIDIEFWKPYQKNNYDLGEIPTILYAGRIGTANAKSILFMSNVINSLNIDQIKIKLDIFSPDINTKNARLFNNLRGVQLKNAVPYTLMPSLLASYDLLFLPLDFDKKGIKYAQFSMPTKVSEYMVSGTPIIIFAPEVTAIVKYAKKYDWAKVITENNISEISGAIKQLIENKELRQQIAQNAIKIAEKNYNSIDVTNQFKKVICSVVNDS